MLSFVHVNKRFGAVQRCGPIRPRRGQFATQLAYFLRPVDQERGDEAALAIQVAGTQAVEVAFEFGRCCRLGVADLLEAKAHLVGPVVGNVVVGVTLAEDRPAAAAPWPAAAVQ